MLAALALVGGAPATADDLSVADAQTLTAQLAADLAGNPSATEVLKQWCWQRRLADAPAIVAERKPGPYKPASAKVRALLQAGPNENIEYRRVSLTCGGRVLSRADNWYLPLKLTAEMNATLEDTDTPFGLVVKPLSFHRESLEAKLLIKPDAGKVPAEIIRNKALLETPDGVPFSLVEETYSRTLLDFGPKTHSGGRVATGFRSPREPRERVVVEIVRAPRPPPKPREHHPRGDWGRITAYRPHHSHPHI